MTGEILTQMDLSKIKNKSDLISACKKIPINGKDWIQGFGWDENHFEPGFTLSRKVLDQIFPDREVFFIRADGHSSCVSSKVLALLDIEISASPSQGPINKFIERDGEGLPTGILRESAHMKVYEILPPPEKSQIKSSLGLAINLFHQQGFTHLRDMTTCWPQWEASLEMFTAHEFNAFVEHNFSCEDIEDLDRALKELREARATENKFMKARGVKFFYDGSLGSRTAVLSQVYADETSNRGQRLWSQEAVHEVFQRAWVENFEVSVHVIGDQAVHEIVECARNVSAKGIVGKLNLEHVQVLKPETLKLMKPLHLTCHLQPCHWLSDQVWLKSRLGSLYEYAFPWEALRKAGFNFQFGSDSPIEKPSLSRNLKALRESAKAGLRRLNEDPFQRHTFAFKQVPQGETHLIPEGEDLFQVAKVFFEDKLVYENPSKI